MLIHIRTLRQKSHYIFVSYKFVCLYASQQYSIIYEYTYCTVSANAKKGTYTSNRSCFLIFLIYKAKGISLFTLFFYNLNFPLAFQAEFCLRRIVDAHLHLPVGSRFECRLFLVLYRSHFLLFAIAWSAIVLQQWGTSWHCALTFKFIFQSLSMVVPQCGQVLSLYAMFSPI